LWEEMQKVGYIHFHLGLPGNLWDISNDDMSLYQFDKGYEFYQNGAATHSQTRHFVNALYKVGLIAEGDLILAGLCSSIADGSAYSGVGSGLDWRKWDGTPTGYEGYLCDQLGMLSTIFDRFTLYLEH